MQPAQVMVSATSIGRIDGAGRGVVDDVSGGVVQHLAPLLIDDELDPGGGRLHGGRVRRMLGSIAGMVPLRGPRRTHGTVFSRQSCRRRSRSSLCSASLALPAWGCCGRPVGRAGVLKRSSDGEWRMTKILITGSYGLIGTAITRALVLNGYEVRRLDCRLPTTHDDHGDIRDQLLMKRIASDVDGIMHLAAVSRVQWGDADPDQCWQTNAVGTGNIIRAAAESKRKPVVVVASSREVYGEPTALPVHEDTPPAPINIYGRSKAACERTALAGREAGINTAVVRFSNVYGSRADHFDRVVPAFARAASEGTTMRVCGRGHVFDFTHVDDSASGMIMVLKALLAGERNLPPIHFVTGRATTLEQLAEIAKQAGCGRSTIVEAPARSNDVTTFVGDPTRAEQLLGWRASVAIEDGIRQLVDDFSGAELKPLVSVLHRPARRSAVHADGRVGPI
jgi:nucleoside-diphosphate-sugar epimerase